LASLDLGANKRAQLVVHGQREADFSERNRRISLAGLFQRQNMMPLNRSVK
jgi:hypothetical protein